MQPNNFNRPYRAEQIAKRIQEKKFLFSLNGTTLLELLLALLILSILLGVSLPGFSRMLANTRTDQAMQSLTEAIALSKSNAIMTQKTVTLCRSRDQQNCVGNWEQGFIVFTDENGNRKIDIEDKLLLAKQFPNLQGNLRWRAFRNRQYLQFTAEGFTRYQNGNFTFCPDSKNPREAQQLIISRTARVRKATDSDGDDIVENSRGKPIDCD